MNQKKLNGQIFQIDNKGTTGFALNRNSKNDNASKN